MNKVYVWVNLLVDLSAAKVMSELIQYGFTVTPLCRDGILSHADLVGGLLNLSLAMNTTDTPEAYAKAVDDILTEILAANKIAYSMLLVSSPAEIAHWNLGNIKRGLPTQQMPKLRLVKAEEKAN